MQAIKKWCLYLYLPAIFYIIFIIVKATVEDIQLDLAGMHAVIGAVFIIMGATICYFAGLTRQLIDRPDNVVMPTHFWVLSCLLFILLFYDAAYGIHEQMPRFGLPELSFFLVEGSLLVTILFFNYKMLEKVFLILFALFVVMSGSAVIGDSSSGGEGVISLWGNIYSFEQGLETLSLLVLASAFMLQALSDIKTSIAKT